MCALVPRGGADGYLLKPIEQTWNVTGIYSRTKRRVGWRGVVIASVSVATHAPAHGRITVAIARGVVVPAFTALVAAANARNDVGFIGLHRHRLRSRVEFMAERHHHRMVMVVVRAHGGWFGRRVGGGGVGVVAAVADVVSA